MTVKKEELRKEFDRHMNFGFGTSTSINVAPVHAGDDRIYSNLYPQASQVNMGHNTITTRPDYSRAFEWAYNEILDREKIIKDLQDGALRYQSSSMDERAKLIWENMQLKKQLQSK